MSWAQEVQAEALRLLQWVSPQARAQELSPVIEPLVRLMARCEEPPEPPGEEVYRFAQVSQRAALLAMSHGRLSRDGLSSWEPLFSLAYASLCQASPLSHYVAAPTEPPRLQGTFSPMPCYVLDAALLEVGEDPEPDPRQDEESFADEGVEAATDAGEAEDELGAAADAGEQEGADTDEGAAGGELEPPVALYEPDRAELPRVRLDPELAEPIMLLRFYRDVVGDALDTLGMLARHRVERRLDEASQEESRILELMDALANVGPPCLRATERWWLENLDSPDPWQVWSPTFAIGCFHVPGALEQISRQLELLPRDDDVAVKVASDALMLCTHPDLHVLLGDLKCSVHPAKRAIGVEVLSRAGQLPPEELIKGMADGSRVVALAALRAAARLRPAPRELHALLSVFLHLEDASLAWEASRALLLQGNAMPLHELRQRSLAGVLGHRTLDVLALAGDPQDIPLIENVVSGGDLTSELLLALARFGHAGVWRLLVECLGDEDLVDGAADALELLFGRVVVDERREDPDAWQQAVERLHPVRGVRYRLGRPYRPSMVNLEVADGQVALRELERRFDELTVRCGQPYQVDLGGWWAQATALVSERVERAPSLDQSSVEGAWECRAV